MDQHWIWSDGCVGQFKNARVFQWLSMLHKTYDVLHVWNYFETGHGNGEHDGAGACLKTSLRREEMRCMGGPHIWNAESTVRWCKEKMSDRTTEQHIPTGRGHVVRNFQNVVDIDRSRSYSCSTVQGTCGFHSVQISNNALFEIWTRKLACFCGSCSSCEWDEFESMDWVDEWDHVSLAVDPRAVVETIQLEEGQSSISNEYDHISDLVHPGKHFCIHIPVPSLFF